MKKTNKTKISIIIPIITILITILLTTNVKAKTQEISESTINQALESQSINTNNIDKNQILEIYSEYSEKYSNDELANMIEENKEEISEKTGVSQDAISTGTQILKNTDSEELKEILDTEIEKYNNGDKDSIFATEDNSTSNSDIYSINTINKFAPIMLKLLLANIIFKRIITGILIFIILRIIIRGCLLNKAGKHWWATLIPIYRDITYLQMCKINPCVILLALIPILGWIALLIIKIVSKFKLSKAFEKGIAFGFGLWIFNIIFEAILAFSSNIEYKKMMD